MVCAIGTTGNAVSGERKDKRVGVSIRRELRIKENGAQELIGGP